MTFPDSGRRGEAHLRFCRSDLPQGKLPKSSIWKAKKFYNRALLYLGCALVMNFTTAETTRAFFNSLFQGIDVGSILRMNISFQQTVAGLIQAFVIAWLIGASVAAIYNILISTRQRSRKI